MTISNRSLRGRFRFGFTDIEFNPNRQTNCQAAAAAFYVSLRNSGRLEEALGDRALFCRLVGEGYTTGGDESWTGAAAPIVQPVAAIDLSSEDRPASGVRQSCPEGFTDARELADAQGVIAPRAKACDAGIVRLWIPQEVKSIGSSAFRGCANLKEVVCEECGGGAGLEIGLMAFAKCGALQKVSLPSRLRSIGAGAFRDDPQLTDFSIPKDHYAIACADHVFDNCPDGEVKLSAVKS